VKNTAAAKAAIAEMKAQDKQVKKQQEKKAAAPLTKETALEKMFKKDARQGWKTASRPSHWC
jgi:hypothetical protein